jgi:hypothetical protein
MNTCLVGDDDGFLDVGDGEERDLLTFLGKRLGGQVNSPLHCLRNGTSCACTRARSNC